MPTLPLINWGDLQNTHAQHDTDRGVCQIFCLATSRNIYCLGTCCSVVGALLSVAGALQHEVRCQKGGFDELRRTLSGSTPRVQV